MIDLDRPDARRIRERGAAHPGESQADADVDVGEAGTKRPKQHERGLVEPVGDLGPSGGDPDQDEERHRKQGQLSMPSTRSLTASPIE